MTSKKTAVVLFNLGGPLSQDDVRPFLTNLFNDRAIIDLPGPMRWVLSRLIARRREQEAKEVYANLGGGSPLLINTKAQQQALSDQLGDGYRVFVTMRYWHPFAAETVAAVQAYNPDQVVLLPLYPQFSTTTTASSLKDWYDAAKAVNYTPPTLEICCYGDAQGVVDSFCRSIDYAVAELPPPYGTQGAYRVLFSAHGLPERIVEKRRDPYPKQVMAMVDRIAARLSLDDFVVCYQSRVGPLKWIGPSIDEALQHAAADGKAVIVVPIAFVSEHSETLVELDMQYRDVAKSLSIPAYVRAKTPGVDPLFIGALANLVRAYQQQTIKKTCPYRLNPCDTCFKNPLQGV